MWSVPADVPPSSLFCPRVSHLTLKFSTSSTFQTPSFLIRPPSLVSPFRPPVPRPLSLLLHLFITVSVQHRPGLSVRFLSPYSTPHYYILFQLPFPPGPTSVPPVRYPSGDSLRPGSYRTGTGTPPFPLSVSPSRRRPSGPETLNRSQEGLRGLPNGGGRYRLVQRPVRREGPGDVTRFGEG